MVEGNLCWEWTQTNSLTSPSFVLSFRLYSWTFFTQFHKVRYLFIQQMFSRASLSYAHSRDTAVKEKDCLQGAYIVVGVAAGAAVVSAKKKK